MSLSLLAADVSRRKPPVKTAPADVGGYQNLGRGSMARTPS
jgi:hypothetical protein